MRWKPDVTDEEEIAEDLMGIRDSLEGLKRKWKDRLEGYEDAEEEDKEELYWSVSDGIEAVDTAIGYIDSAVEAVREDVEDSESTIQEADYELSKRRTGER